MQSSAYTDEEVDVGSRDYNDMCPECKVDNTHCLDCGEWTGMCICADGCYDAYCDMCGITFDPYIGDEDEGEYTACVCENQYTENLICDECDVYRLSINDPWFPKSYDPEGPCCKCSPKKDWVCADCGVERNTITNQWMYSKGVKVHHYYKCRHYDNEIHFGDVTVYASSRFNRKASDDKPDFGVYLDSLWYAPCPAYFIDWPDFGLPTDWEVAARCIIDAYKKAENNLWVEVGCIGGHGRTGTVLACMAVLSGMQHEDAVDYIRHAYCSQAIESDEQEWYVEWFDAYVNGGTTKVKTSQILGKKVEHDKIHQFKYDGMTDWREREMVYASGKKPTPKKELSKSKYVRTPDPEPDGSEVYGKEQLKADLDNQDGWVPAGSLSLAGRFPKDKPENLDEILTAYDQHRHEESLISLKGVF